MRQPLKLILKLISKHLGLLLLLAGIGITLLEYKNYGMSWDELAQHDVGDISYNYVFHGDKALDGFFNKEYGVGFEVPLIIAERLLDLKDSRDIFIMRHLLCHLFFLLSAFICFLLVDRLYKSKLLAAIGFIFYTGNPVIYGHSFFNSKDIPFMSMFTICFFLLAIGFNKKRLGYFALLGAGCGYLMNLRLMGILLVGCICLFLIFDMIFPKKDKKQFLRHLYLLLIFIGTACVTLYATWPFLWADPVHNLLLAFNKMSNFPLNGTVLFMGHYFEYGQNLSWYYGIVCFLISNPLLTIAAGLFGIALFVLTFIKSPLECFSGQIGRANSAFLLCFLAPLAAVVILRSTLYNGWRHLFFIYPAFVLLAMFGLDFLLKTRLKKVITVVCFLGFFYIAYFMASNFPFYHVYFNQLISCHEPEFIRKNFDLDYWGVSYRQGLEYILKNDSAEKITIAVNDYPGYFNRFILKPEERRRLNYVFAEDSAKNRETPKYFITDYLCHPEDYHYQAYYDYHSFKVMNNSILTIFKEE